MKAGRIGETFKALFRLLLILFPLPLFLFLRLRFAVFSRILDDQQLIRVEGR